MGEPLKAARAEAIPGPWSVDRHGLGIWAPNAKIGGETKILDIRGWGYLTGHGHGALAMPHHQAEAVQMATGALAASAPDLLDALRPFAAFLEAMEKMGGNFPREGRFYTLTAHEVGEREITVEHFKAARAAILKATSSSSSEAAALPKPIEKMG